jgi:TRAP-type C4-dicarboxylate transport system permease small subunit
MARHGIALTDPLEVAGAMAAPDVPRGGVLGAVQAVLDGINAILAVASALAIAMAGCVLTWEVVGRYFLAIPSDWQDELSTFLLVGATFCSASWVQARRGHVAIDALAEILPASVDRARRSLADLLTFLFVSYFAWKCWEMLVEVWQDDETTSSAWGPPLYIPYGCMTVGMALLACQVLLQLLGRRHRGAQPVNFPTPSI